MKPHLEIACAQQRLVRELRNIADVLAHNRLDGTLEHVIDRVTDVSIDLERLLDEVLKQSGVLSGD